MHHHGIWRRGPNLKDPAPEGLGFVIGCVQSFTDFFYSEVTDLQIFIELSISQLVDFQTSKLKSHCTFHNSLTSDLHRNADEGQWRHRTVIEPLLHPRCGGLCAIYEIFLVSWRLIGGGMLYTVFEDRFHTCKCANFGLLTIASMVSLCYGETDLLYFSEGEVTRRGLIFIADGVY